MDQGGVGVFTVVGKRGNVSKLEWTDKDDGDGVYESHNLGLGSAFWIERNRYKWTKQQVAEFRLHCGDSYLGDWRDTLQEVKELAQDIENLLDGEGESLRAERDWPSNIISALMEFHDEEECDGPDDLLLEIEEVCEAVRTLRAHRNAVIEEVVAKLLNELSANYRGDEYDQGFDAAIAAVRSLAEPEGDENG
jgi:hypothetical protein